MSINNEQQLRRSYVRRLAAEAVHPLVDALTTDDLDEMVRLVGKAGETVGKAEGEMLKADLR